MSHEDVHNTIFKTHNEHYKFIIMPFGLTNTTITFQSLMNELFRVYLRKIILVFFDDILIYNNSMIEHLEHLKIVFKLLKANKLYAKANKCVF
jgi:hypothetical protein